MAAVCVLVVALTTACTSAETPPAADAPPTSQAPAETAEPAPETTEPDEDAAEDAAEDEGAEDADGADDAAAAPAEEILLTISDFSFVVPATVAPGAVVTVVNEDQSFHTVTADDGSFDVGAPSGEPVTFTAPTTPGEYSFHCGPHPEMVATLVVG